MKWLDLSLPTPERNLACDELLLQMCEEGEAPEVLRFWESDRYFVVVGYMGEVGEEVNEEACRANGIPILRRSTGGGTVLQGPGCLNYALVLRIGKRKGFDGIRQTNMTLMQRMAKTIGHLLGNPVDVNGSTDLTLGGLKFSGNAQRRKRKCLLFHGTILYDFNIAIIERYLPIPPRQPAYRKHRSHRDFLTNIPLRPEQIKAAMVSSWRAEQMGDGEMEGKL